jgi:hypothetical protein
MIARAGSSTSSNGLSHTHNAAEGFVMGKSGHSSTECSGGADLVKDSPVYTVERLAMVRLPAGRARKNPCRVCHGDRLIRPIHMGRGVWFGAVCERCGGTGQAKGAAAMKGSKAKPKKPKGKRGQY